MTPQFYYLSPCARTSAEWLADRHVESSLTYIPRLLSTAAQFVVCEASPILLPIYNPAEPHMKWLLKSVYNYQWGLSYYNTLVELGEYKFKFKHNTYRLQRELTKYLHLFPDVDFTPPPCLFDEEYILDTTEKSYRNYYKQVEAKAGSYHKMVTPFWVKVSMRLPIVRQSQQWVKPQESDPFADLK